MIRKFNFLAGVLLAMSAVVSCGSDDEAKVVDTTPLVKDAHSAIDNITTKEEVKELATLLAITITSDVTVKDAKTAAKKAVKETAEKIAKATNVAEAAKKETERINKVKVTDAEVIAVRDVLSKGYKKIAEGTKEEKKK